MSVTFNQRSWVQRPPCSFPWVKHFLPVIFLGNKDTSRDNMPGTFIGRVDL